MNLSEIMVIVLIVLPSSSFVFLRRGMATASAVIAFIELGVVFWIYFFPPPVGIFYVTPLTWIFILMVSSVYLLATIYSIRYMEGLKVWISPSHYYLMLNLFTSAMLFSLVINDYGLMWVGIESTTVLSALLIVLEKNENTLEATWRYIILVSAGVAFAFISIILIYYTTGSLSVSVDTGAGATGRYVSLAVGIALLGFGTKVGVFPVHTWLPDAHSEAPPAVSAMFSGVLLPVALYVLYRIYEIQPMPYLYGSVAVLSIAFSAIFLGNQKRYKRMFAYSTMENMNLALLGFAIHTDISIAGAILLLLAHSYGKAGAFFSSGSILKHTGSHKIGRVKGLFRDLPMTGTSLLLSSLAVTGAPPSGVFFAEILIFMALVTNGYYIFFVITIISVFLSFVSINYNVGRMLFSDSAGIRERRSSLTYISLVSSIMPSLVGILFLVGYYAMF